MSKLFDDASLAMIPSAYKDGKLYSIRPTDGSGDFTFSRGSNLAATRVDVNGLIEKGRENLFLHSEDVSNSAYAKIGVNATYNQIANPVNGSVTADKLETNGDANVEHMVRVTNYITTGVKTLSVYVKYINYQYVYLRELANNKYAVYDIQNGVVTREDAASSQISTNIESVGNGWYRLSMTFLVTSITNNLIDVGLSYSDTSFSGSMSAGSEAYFYGFQLEAGLVATDYIETGASTAQAGILEDMPRLDYSGSCPALLLEPQRSNFMIQSEYFNASEYSYVNAVTRTPNAGVSPDGFNNAYLVTEVAANAAHRIGQAAWGQNVENTSVSIFAKTNGTRYIVLGNANMSPSMNTWFDLENGVVGTESPDIIDASIEPFENGWYRCSISYLPNKSNTYPTIYLANSDGGSLTYVGDGVSGVYLYGYQIEYGSYPTSYIPTYGSSVTRSKEQCNVNNVTGEIGQTQGTIFLDADLYKKTNTEFYIAISDGTLSNSIYLHQSAQSLLVNKRISGVTQFLQIIPANWSSGRNKCAITYTATEMKIFVNGVLKDTETINGLPSGLSKLTLGSRQDNLGELASNSNFKQAVLFPTALTDSECIALTTL
jgi:hypothetical protein